MRVRHCGTHLASTATRKRASVHFVAAVALVLSIATCAFSQTSQSPSVPGGTGPRNWRDVPVPLNAHPDAVSTADRAARDDSFALLFPAPRNGLVAHLGGTVRPRQAPEIARVPGSFWAIGTFVDYDVYEIATGGIYTEIHFRLDRIIGPSHEPGLQAGQVIDIDVAGGTVKTPSGEVHHREGWRDMYDNPMLPRHKYLIQLLPRSPGKYYEAVDYWDLTSGSAQAVLSSDVLHAREGVSQLHGRQEDEAVALILKSFASK